MIEDFLDWHKPGKYCQNSSVFMAQFSSKAYDYTL